MEIDFQRSYWASRLAHSDWYNYLEDELRQLFFPIVHDDAELKRFRHKVYELVEELLESNNIPLAEHGPNLDAERQPIDTIVIHHTTEEPDIRLGKLSAIGLVRQYAFQYLANNILGEHVRGQAIWSGHFREGKMVFFAYHWLIRLDGTAERLLGDEAIGWHAGNWDINTRSVGIAFSGDYEEAEPPLVQIEAAAQVVREHYPQVERERVMGHREVVEQTSCPGGLFLGGWKERLLHNQSL